MKLAFVSYEFAGIGSGGGIGTYVRNASRMLADRGHQVEVFCGGEVGKSVTTTEGVLVHTISTSRSAFSNTVRALFSDRHNITKFDVVEGPEFGADAIGVRQDHPNLPLVVRLHTPTCMINEINNSFVTSVSKARYVLGGLRRGKIYKPYWKSQDQLSDTERQITLKADRIIAPSHAILKEVNQRWGLPSDISEVLPNVFEPQTDLIRLVPMAHSKRVIFLGKLEVRKGVLDLARAVPIVAREFPDVEFVFVGRDMPMPGASVSVGTEMRRLVGRWANNATYFGAVDYAKIPALLESASIAILPSVWENFPYVCLEAMVAAKAVVASSAGGMAEIIEHKRTGLLVPPRDHIAIASAIVELLRDLPRTISIGLAARRHVLKEYGAASIGSRQEASYQAAIESSAFRFKEKLLR